MIEFHAEMMRRLNDPLAFEWRGHGIGMLRTYLAPDVRLNLWHRDLVNPGISTMHTHPWGFRSHVLLGELRNTRWERVTEDAKRAEPYIEDKIGCGEHFDGLKGEARTVWLRPYPVEVIGPGAVYSQEPDELHTTEFVDGTASVIVRGATVTEGSEASVFWPLGDQWGDATRDITEADIWTVVSAAVALVDHRP